MPHVTLFEGFSAFPVLEKVHLKGYCPNFTAAVLSGNGPPNLQEVVAEGEDPILGPDEWSSQQEAIAEQVVECLPYLDVEHCNIPKSKEQPSPQSL